MTDSTSTAPEGSVWTPVPLPPDFVELVLKNRAKIEALAEAGLFSFDEGKATVHIKNSLIHGVQLESWVYRREAQAKLSTPPHVSPTHVPM